MAVRLPIGNVMKVRFAIYFILFILTIIALHTEFVQGKGAIIYEVTVGAYPSTQGVNAPLSVRAFIHIIGACCGTPFEVRGIEAVITTSNDTTIINGANPQKLEIVTVPYGIEKVIKAEWIVKCYSIGVHPIRVDVTSENAFGCSGFCDFTIAEGPAISEPTVDPKSPTVYTDTVVSIIVDSSFGVKNATLHYNVFGQLEEQIIKMRRDPTQNDQWIAVIPKQPETIVSFYIVAFDNGDNFAKSPPYSYKVKDIARIESGVRFTAWTTVATCVASLIIILFGYWKFIKPHFVGNQRGLLVLGTAKLHREFYGINRVESVPVKLRRRYALLLRLAILVFLFLLWSAVLSRIGWIW